MAAGRGRVAVAAGTLATILGVSLGALILKKPELKATARIVDRGCRGGCMKASAALGPAGPLLTILPTGFSSSLIASGSLTASNGSTVSNSSASPKYCNGTSGLVRLSSHPICVEAPGLLVEGASTNIVLQSNALGTSPWALSAGSTNPIVTNNSADVTDPAGGNTATKVVLPAVSSGGYSIIYQNVAATSGQPQALSVYMRTLSGTGTVYITWNTSSTYVSRGTCSVTSNWTRCTGTGGSATTSGGFFVFGVDLRDTGQSAQPAQTVYAWGVQLEQQSFASSYIPTTTSSATRASDNITVANPIAGTPPSALSLSSDFTPNSGTSYASQLDIIDMGATFSNMNLLEMVFSSSGINISACDGTSSCLFGGSSYLSTVYGSHHGSCSVTGGGSVLQCAFDGFPGSKAMTGSGAGVQSLNAQVQIGEKNYQGPVTGGAGPMNAWFKNICITNTAAGCS